MCCAAELPLDAPASVTDEAALLAAERASDASAEVGSKAPESEGFSGVGSGWGMSAWTCDGP